LNPVIIDRVDRKKATKLFYNSSIKRFYNNDQDKLTGYEFLLRQLNLLPHDISIKDYLENNYFDRVSGLYVAEIKKIILVHGASYTNQSKAILHELLHVAQDEKVDLIRLFQSFKTIDQQLSLLSVVEGQAELLELIYRITQSNQLNNINTVLQTFFNKYIKFLESSPPLNNLSDLESFPSQHGLVFTTRQYLESATAFENMFQQIPLSTEQVLHPLKFLSNEVPLKTYTSKEKLSDLLDDTKQLYSTTLGEFFIQLTLNHSLKKHPQANKQASEGWGGDSISVFQHNLGVFLIWDSLWDSIKDAKEFSAQFQKLVQNNNLPKKFGQITAKDNKFYINRVKNRIIILSGNIPNSFLKPIARYTGL
ncbi:MAG: hypothetical protein HON94_05265, partial [Methylococcales bacterium]|nr:hypothetical protein [Methylococcales bacterium]